MLKKIALAAIFALVSVVSFSASTVSAANRSSNQAPAVGAPVMHGICHALGRC